MKNIILTIALLVSSGLAMAQKPMSGQLSENDHIAYATMFGYSNDWFYANDAMIPANFKGDVTEKTALSDDGTAVNQYPGAGSAQGLFTGKPEKEEKNIMKVDNMFPVPAINKVLKIVIK